MSDISSNDNNIDQEIDDQEINDQETDDQESSDLESDYNETSETIIYTNDIIDYSSHFENIETIGIFISGLLVAYGIAFAFFKGFKK